jgi:hypothetical protein
MAQKDQKAENKGFSLRNSTAKTPAHEVALVFRYSRNAQQGSAINWLGFFAAEIRCAMIDPNRGL